MIGDKIREINGVEINVDELIRKYETDAESFCGELRDITGISQVEAKRLTKSAYRNRGIEPIQKDYAEYHNTKPKPDGYIEKYIEREVGIGENLILTAKVDRVVLFPGVFLIFISIMLLAVNHYIALMLTLVGFIMLLPAIIKMRTTILALTNKRILGKRGTTITSSLDAPLNKINNISITSTSRHHGNITITTSSGSFNYEYIADAGAFKNAILAQIERFDEDKMKKQAAEIAKAMKSE